MMDENIDVFGDLFEGLDENSLGIEEYTMDSFYGGMHDTYSFKVSKTGYTAGQSPSVGWDTVIDPSCVLD